MLRARGGRPVTTSPSISTSPLVGCSRPAIVRSSVVLPQPDGPSRTRYSPSSVARLTLSIARTTPERRRRSCDENSLTRSRTSMTATVSGPAAHEPGLAPLVVDGLDLVLRVDHRLLRAHLATGRAGEHVRDHERREDLADGRV